MNIKEIIPFLLLLTMPSIVFAARPSINELNTRVNQLEAENNSQQSEIDTMRARQCALYTQLYSSNSLGVLSMPGDCNRALIFVTEDTYTGNLGGLTGADEKCQVSASQAGLPGTYKAWLSDSVTSATDRLNHSAIAYYSTNGALVAVNWDDLTDGALYSPVNANQFGNFTETASSNVWTGTDSNGISNITDPISPGLVSCQNWTADISFLIGPIGSKSSTNSTWTENGGLGCDQPARLYCVQQ